MTQSDPPPVAHGKCPICRRPWAPPYRPFCSRRCADVDLARWLRGTYVIPEGALGEEADEAAAPDPDQQSAGSRH